MAGSHTHRHAHPSNDELGDVQVAKPFVTALFVFLAACAAATVTAVAVLWPEPGAIDKLREDAQFAAPDVTFVDAKVDDVQPTCPDTRSVRDTCGNLTARVEEGAERGTSVTVPLPAQDVEAGLASGDGVRLMRIPPQAGQAAIYSYDGIVRHVPLFLMAGVFVLVVAGVARIRGLLALVALGFGGLVLFRFMLPALLSGSSGAGVALAGSAAIMFVVLYLAHGPSVRTSVALAGTLLGVALTAAVGAIAVGGATLTGLADDSGAALSAFATDLSFQGLLMCALVVAGLGVLNDVTITQTSAVWELRAAAPGMGRRELFTSGMRIGRDHIASTIYTIVFAYAGSALAVLLLISLYDRPVLDLLNTEPIAEEIVRTLASGIGLVLAVPLTTAVAALCVAGPRPD